MLPAMGWREAAACGQLGARKVLGGQLLWPLSHHADSPSLAAEEWGPASSQLAGQEEPEGPGLSALVSAWLHQGSERHRPARLGPGGRKA